MWRGPRALCRGGDCETACVWSGSSVFTLSDGVWCCSGTTVVGPTWWWPSSVRCGLLSCFPSRRGAVPDGGYMRWRRKVVSRGFSRVVSFVSTSQSNWTGLSLGDVCVACVDVPFRAACGVVFRRVLMSQSNPPVLLSSVLFFFLVMASHGYILIFFLLYQ